MGALARVEIDYVPVADYLASTFSPDVDYVDGILEERNVGEFDHGDLQGEITALFRNHGKEWGVRCVPEVRVQVSATRFRVPDVCVMPRSWKKTQIIRVPPLLCVEVLSPKDLFSKSQKKFRDYINMGVPEVWIVSPSERAVHVLTSESMTVHQDGVLHLQGTSVQLSVPSIFEILDEA